MATPKKGGIPIRLMSHFAMPITISYRHYMKWDLGVIAFLTVLGMPVMERALKEIALKDANVAKALRHAGLV